MLFLYAQGINQTGNLAPLPHAVGIEQYLTFNQVASADGITRNVSGGRLTLLADALAFDEAIDIVQFVGVSTHRPATECTIQVPDVYRIPQEYNAVVTLRVSRASAWWTNFRLDFTGVVHVT